MTYTEIVAKQREYYFADHTRNIEFRIQQLNKLKTILQQEEKALYKAIYADFKKSEFETYGSELSFIYHAIDTATRKVSRWAAPKRVKTNLLNFPARSYVIPESLGVSLIIGAWNYPYMLSLLPTVSAITAGNTVIIKPSEFPAQTSEVLARIINSNFDPAFLHVVEGGEPETTALLEERFDKIFFTGSTKVGKIIYAAAAKHLTPVTLELGGKSPAIVTKDCNIKEAARRISWGKFLNAGQTCVAPDYVVINESIRDEFLMHLVEYIKSYDYNFTHDNYVQIINDRNFERLSGLLAGQDIFYGGEMDRNLRYIGPTILTNVSFDQPVMQEEIFGPILPVISYNNFETVIQQLKQLEKPLACYLFTNDKTKKNHVLREFSFGGGAVNDTMMHIANPNLPYGGVGASGMGSYHDESGFKAFSHYKAILDKPLWFETNLKYPPYTRRKFKWLKYLLAK